MKKILHNTAYIGASFIWTQCMLFILLVHQVSHLSGISWNL